MYKVFEHFPYDVRERGYRRFVTAPVRGNGAGGHCRVNLLDEDSDLGICPIGACLLEAGYDKRYSVVVSSDTVDLGWEPGEISTFIRDWDIKVPHDESRQDAVWLASAMGAEVTQ